MVEEIFHLHISMFRWLYIFSAEECMLYRLEMVIVPIFIFLYYYLLVKEVKEIIIVINVR